MAMGRSEEGARVGFLEEVTGDLSPEETFSGFCEKDVTDIGKM